MRVPQGVDGYHRYSGFFAFPFQKIIHRWIKNPLVLAVFEFFHKYRFIRWKVLDYRRKLPYYLPVYGNFPNRWLVLCEIETAVRCFSRTLHECVDWNNICLSGLAVSNALSLAHSSILAVNSVIIYYSTFSLILFNFSSMSFCSSHLCSRPSYPARSYSLPSSNLYHFPLG